MEQDIDDVLQDTVNYETDKTVEESCDPENEKSEVENKTCDPGGSENVKLVETSEKINNMENKEGIEDSDSDDERCSMKRPNLLEQLKTILDTYPDDAQIIKELIQNAEDANATEIKLLHDKRNIQPEGELGKYFKTPALCVYNDAEFTDDDWEGIISIYNSVKKNDKLKVGRFGLGFKSVFHLTDHPVIISGDKMLIIDPLQSLKSEQDVCDKKRLKSLAKQKYSKSIAHLNNVFEINGNVLKGEYRGTFFWFPLRDKPSVLSDNIYTEQKMVQLFETFEEEAMMVVLFLKSLLKIETICRCEDLSDQIQTLHTVSMTGSNEQLQKRTVFKNEVLELKGELPVTSLWSTYEVTMTAYNDNECLRADWIIVNYIQGTTESTEKLTSLAQDPDLSYSPYVGVAYPCVSNGTIETGHVFCFLPLPLEKKSLTGLPVHVNGLFALEQNRKHVKWGNRDQSHVMVSKDKHVLWNEMIISDVLSKAYEHLVGYLIQKSQEFPDEKDFISDVVRSIPTLSKTGTNWEILLNRLLPRLLGKDIFYTENEGGKWISQEEAIFPLFSPAAISDEMEVTITTFILMAGKNIVPLENNLKEIVVDKNYNSSSVCGITPELLRNVLHSCSEYKTLNRKDKINLLCYAAADKSFSELNGIELLPLSNGTFRNFHLGHCKEDERIYLCKNGEEAIFLGLENRFVSTRDDIPVEVIKMLEEMADSGMFQLQSLTKEDFPYLYQNTIDQKCQKNEENECFIPTTDIINLNWLEMVWRYINNNFGVNGDLDMLHTLPLIAEKLPENQSVEKLLPLKGFYVVGNCDGMSTLSTRLDNILSMFSITKFQAIPAFLKNILGTFIHYPNHESMFKLLSEVMTEIPGDKITECFNKTSLQSDKMALVEFLSEKTEIIPSDLKSLFKHLQMFMVSINTVGYISKIPEFTALIQNNLLVPESKFPVPYPYQMIETSTSKVKELALALGAAVKESSELIKDVLEILLSDTERKTYNTDEVKDFMDFFLVQITTFESSILQMAKRVVFIPSSDTELYCALDLFDPRDEKLEILFHGEAKFPTQPYDSDDTLNALLKIGLKRSKDVTPDEILNSAKILDALDTENNVEREYILKAKKVKYFLNTLIIDMDINKLNELHELRWVAVSERPERYPNCLPWYSEDIGIILSTPKDVLSSDLCLLSGSVQSFVDVTEASAILEKFQWNKFPTESLILEQLNCIARIFEPAHRPELLPMVASIYNHLAKLDSDYACFKDAECILCEDTFRKPCEVYIKEGGETETFNLHPYMSKLPAEFVHLEKLFLAFGCKEILSADILKSVLEKIKQMHNKKSKRSKLKKNIRSDLQLVIQIVKYLDGLCLQDTELEDVLLPIKTKGDCLVLKYPAECTYGDDDADWLFEATEEDSIEDDIFYVHKEINPNMAKRFGVPSLTNRFLTEDNSEDMVMEWGQSEPLTTRLNNLLEGYTDGFAIPKEIVQNADDAGATEVAFLYDERENKNAGSYLIDPNMAECQGPALWAYNNSIFQESDFKNIIKLGGRTKEADESTIGKFGLGFCSVYNLTDVPSFYSGNSMVIFDPHGNYLGRALKNKENPGLRFKLNKKIVKCLHSQFQPFHGVFGCSLSDRMTQNMEYKGTLFRFPLRTQKQAENSLIKAMHYSRQEMTELIDMFTRSAGDLLLFTQSIKTIKVYHLPPKSTNPVEKVLLFSADKLHQTSVPKHMRDEHVLRYFLSNQEEELSVVHQFRISVNITENMQCLCKRTATSGETDWLISWGSSRNCFKAALKGGVPIGATAIPVSVMNEKLYLAEIPRLPEGFYKSSHLFCFLPLPVDVKLPFHLNGCFSVEQDRKCLTRKSKDEKASEKAQWNNAIFSGAVCNSFLNLLNLLKDKVSNNDYEYSQLWPQLSSNERELAEFFKSFYQKIVHGDYKVFSQNEKWYSFKESCFLDPVLRFDKNVGNMAFDCFLQFAGDRNVVNIREDIINCLDVANCIREFQERVLKTETFYQEVFFKNISSEIWLTTKQKILERDKLTVFALKSKNNTLRMLVSSNECISTRGKEMLRKPEDLIHPQMLAASLFDENDERFPTKLFCDKEGLDALSELGMKGDLIPFEWLKERANTIRNLSKEMALKRCKSLLEYILNCLDRNDHGYNLFELADIKFLPLEEKPANWPLAWKGQTEANKDKTETLLNSENIFTCPKQLYFPKEKQLVGAVKCIVHTFDPHRYLGVLKAIGVQDVVTVDAVFKQLEIVSECTIENMKETEKEELRNICFTIYKFMNYICKDENNELEQHFGRLESQRIILTSDTEGKEILIKPSIMAFNRPSDSIVTSDCRPYLYFVDHSLKKFTEFLKKVGIREQFSSSFILGTLNECKEKFGTEPCSEKDALLVVSLIKLLFETCREEKISLSDNEMKTLIVPDEDRILRSPYDLCYDEDYGTLGKMKFMHFVHSSIDVGLMKVLGIKSKRVQHLKSFAGAMDFGQKEKLVTRLKGLLEQYPFDSTILNELLQNADDASASEIHFILDERTHPKSGVFDESWKPLQGPSLVVYNDTCFSASDIQGIQNLGQGSKSDDPTKTGQFGLGFNATYHLTDVPSFLTRGPDTPNGGTLCIFDPHCNYAPLARPESPGMQLPNLSEVQEHYPSVYNTYLQDHIPSDKGTWFRFPLRDREMSKKSDICKDKVINVRAILDLYDLFLKDMQRALLFVSNVQEIKLSRISKTDNILRPIYRVKALLTDDDRNVRASFNQYVKMNMAKLRAGECLITEMPSKEIVYGITIEDSFMQITDWIVVQRFGISKNTPDLLIKAVKNGEIGLAPRAGIALPLINETKLKPFTKEKRSKKRKIQKDVPSVDAVSIYKDMLISLNNPLQISLNQQKNITKEIRNEKSKQKTEKINKQTEIGDFKVFCFLPTPIRSGLPLHINGHFVLDPARRNMFRDGDEQSIRGEWNTMILNDIIPKAYIKGMTELREYLMKLVDKRLILPRDAIAIYHQVFPIQTDVQENRFKSLVNCVYQNIIKEEVYVFPVLNYLCTDESYTTTAVSWFPLISNLYSFPVFFNDLHLQFLTEVDQRFENMKVTNKNKQALEKQKIKEEEWAKQESTGLAALLKSIGLKLTELPLWILPAIKTASITAKSVKPDDVTMFVKSHLENSPDRCRIEELESGSTEAVKNKVRLLLSYCLKSSTFVEHMDKLPLLYTENNELQYFSSSKPVYVSRFCKLLPKSKQMFANEYLVDLLFDLIGKSPSLQVFGIPNFASLLSKSVDENVYKNRKIIFSNQKQESNAIPDQKWLELFWKYLYQQQNKETMVRDCQIFLKDWCLIPGEECGEKVLVSFEHSHRLINLNSFQKDARKEAFLSLQLPKPGPSRFIETIQFFTANEQNYLSILNCLVYNKEHIRKLEIRDRYCTEILLYLHGNINIKQQDKSKLLSLPLYTSISGKQTSLDTGNEMIIFPSDIPSDGLSTWSQKAGLLLVKKNLKTEPLLVKLGAKQCDPLQFYGQYFLSKFDLLDREFIMMHMKYIRDKIIPLYKGDIYQELKKNLKLVKFIPSVVDNHVLVRADTFFSPFNNVCKKMCQDSEFPTPPFNEEIWKKFMEIAGMKSEITEDLFVQFAKQIENGGKKKGVTKTVKEQSEELVFHLFRERKQLESLDLLKRIKQIKFIVPHVVPKKFSDIYPAVKNTSLICFSGSISHHYADISWTMCSLLPFYADPKYQREDHKQIETLLDIYTQPETENVICHAKNICPAFEKKCFSAKYEKGESQQLDRSTMDHVMGKVYEFLNKNNDVALREELCDMPIVYVYDHDLFCTAKQVVLDISSEDEILPYLFKAPVKFGAFHELFRFLGSKDKLTCQHYADVLTAQKRKVQKSSLSPEELLVTRKAVLGFFKGAQKDNSQIQSIDCLYLPGEDKKLYKAGSLVYCNNISFKKRLTQLNIQYLHELDFVKEGVVVENVLQKLPDQIRPHFLTHLVKEKLVDVSTNDILEDSDKVSAVRRFISSNQFIKVVCYLVRHDNQKSSQQVTDEQLTEIRQNIKSIEFTAVRHLKTLLLYGGNIVEGSEQSAHCYYTTADECYKFYFKEGNEDIGKRIRSRLARLILHCTKNLINDQSFTCLSEVVGFVPDISLIEAYLTEHDINIDADFEYIEDEWLPALGSYVPKHDYVLLDNEFTEFRTGEYVAYEIYDPKIDGTNEDSITENLNDPVYIYVKVIEKCGSDTNGEATNPYLVKYKVNMGHGRKESVSVIRMYKFVRRNSTDVVEYTGKQSSYDEAREEEVMKRIRKTLIDAWKLGDEKSRKRIIKRLCLFWHPDKNKGNEEFCTKVFQYIQEIIRQLENGEININSGTGPSYSSWHFTRGSSKTYSRTWYSTFGENVNDRFHSTWNDYQSVFTNRRRNRNRHRQRTEYVYEPNPQEHEAKRWLKQAKEDLVVARRILDCRCENLVGNDTYNWICFIAHQAAEKAIIAITFSIDANKVRREHLLSSVASAQPKETLREKAAKLDNLLGDYDSMRYPDAFSFPCTPSELYDAVKAQEAVKQAQEIIEEVDDYLS